jgi:signal transduction histidine kinase
MASLIYPQGLPIATSMVACNALLTGFLVLMKRRDLIGILYLIVSIFVFGWALGLSFQLNTSLPLSLSQAWGRFAQASAFFIPVVWFQFILGYTKKIYEKRATLIVVYLVTIVIAFFTPTNYYIKGFQELVNVQYPIPGPLFHVHLGLFVAVVSYSFWILYKAWMDADVPEERYRYKLLFIVQAFGFSAGTLTFLPCYGILLPQYNLLLMPLWPLFLGYAMTRHQLFDVEQAIQAFQREKLATIGLIASSINHEIRNPLYIIKGVLETFVENEESGLPNKQPLEVSKKALNNVNRALDVITKLNRFAKPTNEQSAERIEHSASIPEAINTVLDLISYEFELDNIHIKNEINPDVPNIQCDQRQLEEILFNLITNACHAIKSKGKGELRIGTILLPPLRGRIEAGGHPHPVLPPSRGKGLLNDTRPPSVGRDSRITLIIQDTGSGISQNQLKHLFEPFHTTKGEQGTGLGLYITKQLIERNQGKITVKSEEGKGTMFVLEFKQG